MSLPLKKSILSAEDFIFMKFEEIQCKFFKTI